VVVSAQYNNSAGLVSGQTDHNGRIKLALGIFSCDKPIPEIVVAALPVDGYRPTTTASLRSEQIEPWAYRFGFVPIPPCATTPEGGC
jgi:hypothetical protein